ncbi:MAG: hypothetical protein ACTHOI_12500 [Sphingomicrobium sp.]
MTPHQPANDDDQLPTAKDQPAADPAAMFREQPPGKEALLQEETPLPESEADKFAEEMRHDLPAGETMGDAEGSGAGIDIGSGTQEPKPIGGEAPD